MRFIIFKNKKSAVWDKTPLRNLIYYMVHLEGCEQNNRLGLEAFGLKPFYSAKITLFVLQINCKLRRSFIPKGAAKSEPQDRYFFIFLGFFSNLWAISIGVKDH